MTLSDLGVVTPPWPERQSDAGHLPSLMAGTELWSTESSANTLTDRLRYTVCASQAINYNSKQAQSHVGVIIIHVRLGFFSQSRVHLIRSDFSMHSMSSFYLFRTIYLDISM